MNRAVSQVVVAAVCALLGFLLTYQFKELNSANSGNIDYNSSDILSEIENLKKAIKRENKDKNLSKPNIKIDYKKVTTVFVHSPTTLCVYEHPNHYSKYQDKQIS